MLTYIHKQALVAFLSMLAYLCHPFYLLLVCPKRAKLPSYLAFYLLLVLLCPKGAKGLASKR
jgi:hypothetical protein